MIAFVQTENGLDVLYKDETILRHTIDKPVVFIGEGTETIDSYRGNFDIQDYIEQKVGLPQYECFDQSVRFYRETDSITLHFSEEEDRLHINIETKYTGNRFWLRLHAIHNENIYGLGEQASYFNLRGRNYPLWTSEPGVGRDKYSLTTFYANLYDRAGGDYYNTYYPEPTFVSTRKYWFHADSYAYAEFNFRFHNFHELFFWDIPKHMVLSFQSSYLDLIENLTNYVGHVPMLPEYLLDGIILGVQGGIDQVKQYLNQAQQHGVKVSGLWCQDWAGYKHTSFGKRLFWNWVLNEEIYPDLKREIKQFEKNNISFLGYICPFLLENQSLFNEAEEHGYLALNSKNEVYLVDFGEFYSGCVDLTNPKAFEWFKGIIKSNLIDIGIKGWMADFGEYLPVDAVLYNKKNAKLMHNEWPVLWARCNYEAVLEAGKLGEVFYFMRSGGYTSQKYATALWAGDQSVNWEIHDGIPSVIPSALSTGIIGNPFTTSDIGGYTSLHGNIRTKELFERWLEMNVFTSYMRTHEGNRPSQNFQFYNDHDTMNLMARMTSIRVALKPYIKRLIEEGSTKGYPVQRPLFMHYETDSTSHHLQYSYLFGQDMLVQPVIREGQTTQEVYLPQDEWVHLWSGTSYKGRQIVTVDAPIGEPPVFYRKQSAYATLFASITATYRKEE